MSSKMHLGYAFIKAGDREEIIGSNFVNTDNALNGLQNNMISARLIRSSDSFSAEFTFLRASSLRYKNPKVNIHGGSIIANQGSSGQRFGKYVGSTTITRESSRRMVTRATKYVDVDDSAGADQGRPVAIAAINYFGYTSDLADSALGGVPLYREYALSSSFVDIPGNTVGNVFRHSALGDRLMNLEGGDVALSQGYYVISGQYDPPEHLLQHRAYRVYVTKSGGTGTIVGGVKTTGETFPAATNNYTFKDATFNSFSAGDVGKYIAIRSGSHVGTFLITAFIDTATVETDAATINEPFANETGLTWTLRTGPIAEYFWSQRPWHKGFTVDAWWSYALGSAYSLSNMDYHLPGRSTNDVPSAVQAHDGGAHWWTLSIHQEAPHTYRLLRWMHESPLILDPVYNNGDIVNMPLGITLWSDLDVSPTKKLWMSWLGATAPATAPNESKVLAQVDPNPGGDSSIPTAIGVYEAQASVNDATGLCSNQPLGIACDHSSGAVWIFHGTGTRLATDQDNGGISYTLDNGTTWKRLHRLHARTGTATVASGSPNVSSGDTLFQTEFAAGDWIRFGSDTRSYEIASITDETNLVLAENYAGTGGAYSIQKGALTADEAVIAFASTTAAPSTDNIYRAPCDYDTDGNIYWIPSARDRLCRWSPATGAVTTILASAMSNHGSYPLSTLKSLSVARLPPLPDGTDHTFHNGICVGSVSTGGIIIRAADFDSGNNQLWYRFHPSVTTSLSATPYRSQVGTSNNVNFWTDEASGQIYIASDNVTSRFIVYMYPVPPSNIEVGTTVSVGTFDRDLNSNYRVCLSGLRHFDKWGLSKCLNSGGGMNRRSDIYGESNFMVLQGPWTSFGWNGAGWAKMMVNQHTTDLDFDVDASGPYVPGVMTLGAGLRRAMEIDVPLEFGQKLKFVQNGSVAQANEFIVDEKATWVSSIGFAKDNITDMYFGAFKYNSPTVNRKGVAPIDQIRNIWSTDGGIDGGYSTSAVEGALPTFSRGVAEPSKLSTFTGVASYYPNFYSGSGLVAQNNPANFHAMAALRIKDELELSADGSVSAGVDTFTSSGHTFVVGDIGKSIFVEGSAQGNNGQYVILSVAGSQATVDRVFPGTEGSIRWKLRNVPAVGYVLMNFERDESAASTYHLSDFKLYASSDYGQNWGSPVQQSLSYAVVGENNAISVFESDGATLNSRGFHDDTESGQNYTKAFLFDLTGMPEEDRRRQYWKIWRSNTINNGNILRFSCLALFDDNFAPLGAPTSLLLPDASDPLRVGFSLRVNSMVLEDTASLGGAVVNSTDNGDGDGWTDLLTISTGSLYVQSGSDGQTIAGGTPQFVSASAAFTPEMVGMKLRLPGTTPVLPDPLIPYREFVTILSVVDANTVTISINLNSASSLSWQQTKFGFGDFVYFDNDTFLPLKFQELREVQNVVEDVPSSTTILLRKETAPLVAPLNTTGVNFYVWREFPQGIYSNGTPGRYSTSDDIGSGNYFSGYDTKFGFQYFSGDAEFVLLQSGASGTTPADDDGDGRTDQITVPGDVTTGFTGAVAGDYIIVSGGGVGRRVYEIASIVGGGSSAITVTYDELPPNETTLTWQIVRRRFFKQHVRESITTAQETI